ncbi:hypothetical protein U6X42_12370, partial [Cutibacterium acnes]
REYTDTYAVVGGGLRHLDRRFANAPTPYHRLIDGLWSEAMGKSERALQYYAEASTMKASSYEAYDFIVHGEWIEGEVYGSEEEAFEHIVQQFAWFRTELMAAGNQGDARKAACESAKKAAGYSEDWLIYLNAPAGYANPQWDEESVCSQINELSFQ